MPDLFVKDFQQILYSHVASYYVLLRVATSVRAKLPPPTWTKLEQKETKVKCWIIIS